MKLLDRLPPPTERSEKWVRWLAVITTVGMFLVVMAGSTVTNTGSSEGCGRHWPLCQGEFIPSYTVETAIEFTHRIVTGLEGFLLLGTAIGALWIERGRRDVKWLVGIMLGTVLLQSALGAIAVMWPQRPGVLATHFGVSLVCFAATFLLTRLLYDYKVPYDPQAAAPPDWFRYLTYATIPMVLITGYAGAYMRHSSGEVACYTWPKCNGQWIPDFTDKVAMAFTHRLLASLTLILIVSLAFAARKWLQAGPSLVRTLTIAAAAIVVQALIGGAVVKSDLSIWATIAHAGAMAILFVSLCDAVWQLRLQHGRLETARSGSVSALTPQHSPSV